MQFLGLFWATWIPFSKNFPEDPKNTKIIILYPKKYDEIFLENPKKYPDFDFKPLKIPKLQFLGLFWAKWPPFSKNFPEDPKKYQNHQFLP